MSAAVGNALEWFEDSMGRVQATVVEHIERAMLDLQKLRAELAGPHGKNDHCDYANVLEDIDSIAGTLGQAHYAATAIADCATADAEDAIRDVQREAVPS